MNNFVFSLIMISQLFLLTVCEEFCINKTKPDSPNESDVVLRSSADSQDFEDSEMSTINSIETSKPKSLIKRIISKLKIYYGDNDRPVTKKLASVRSYLTRFGYIDYVKRLLVRNVKERIVAHKNRRKKPFKYRITFGQLLYEDIKSMADVVKTAIKLFQRFMRLDVTGLLTPLYTIGSADKPTVRQMNKPRCAGKDLGEQRILPTYMTLKDKAKKRVKRHTLAGSRWTMTNITYKITKYPTSYRDKMRIVDQQIARALKFWSDVTPLTFTRLPAITPSRDVDIDIRFEKGEHGDGDPHDGVGKVLAHAYFPQYGGDAHFDDDEIWTIDIPEGSNILMTATHELGHSLGLDHTDAPDSIMNPIYPPFKPDRQLSQDDIRGIQLLYGARSGVPLVPNICLNASIDAIFQKKNSIFAFKDKYFWKIKSEEMNFDSDYPKPISQFFPTIESDINAAIEVSDSSVYVFKGDVHYKYQWDCSYEFMHLVDGYPLKISDAFPTFPIHMDAAISLGKIIYAFKDDKYWTYGSELNETEKEENAKLIQSKWPGVPERISAVFSNKNTIYFFKDQGFYRLNLIGNQYRQTQSRPPYPRKTSLWWLGCQ